MNKRDLEFFNLLLNINVMVKTLVQGGGDDAEDYEHPEDLKKNFPATLAELECAWQLQGKYS